MKIKMKLDDKAFMPVRAYETDAGMDILSPVDCIVPANGSVSIDPGVHVEIPKGYAIFLKSKSGLMVNHNIRSEGVIDSGFSGSIVAKMFNDGPTLYRFFRGDKITQMVLLPIETPEIELVEEIDSGDRGDNGFGSTGR